MLDRSLAEKVLTTLRSGLVGLVATAADLVALAVLVSGAGVPAQVASAPALAVGVAFQFVGNKLFAFQDHSQQWLRQGAQFLLVEILGFAANLLLFHVALEATVLPYLPLRLATTSLVYFGICLPLWGRIFHKRHASDDARVALVKENGS
jgi:putative flippase GtrA